MIMIKIHKFTYNHLIFSHSRNVTLNVMINMEDDHLWENERFK